MEFELGYLEDSRGLQLQIWGEYKTTSSSSSSSSAIAALCSRRLFVMVSCQMQISTLTQSAKVFLVDLRG